MSQPEWATSDPNAEKAAADAKAKEEAEMQRLAEEEARKVAFEREKEQAVKEAKLAEQENYNKRMQELEVLLKNRWSEKETPPQQRPQSSVTAEDFLDPEKAMAAAKRLSQEAAAEAAAYVTQQHARDSAELRELQFDTVHEKLKADPLYKYVAEDIDAAMRANPNLRRAPKALQILYDNLKGRKALEIAEGERNAYLENERKRKIDPSSSPISTSTGPPPRPSNDEGDTGPQLTDTERRFLANFEAKGGIRISPERWVELRAQRERERSEVPNYDTERRG